MKLFMLGEVTYLEGRHMNYRHCGAIQLYLNLNSVLLIRTEVQVSKLLENEWLYRKTNNAIEFFVEN
jgi:hypothetical protein